MRLQKRKYDTDSAAEPLSSVAIRRAAMDLLARREFSRNELKQRLEARFGYSELIADALDQLINDGLQSDERYAEALVRSRRSRQQGPTRIRHELVNKGIPESMANAYADARDRDWYELARGYRIRKFGEALPSDPRERARQQRHLMQRGFNHEHIRYALRHSED